MFSHLMCKKLFYDNTGMEEGTVLCFLLCFLYYVPHVSDTGLDSLQQEHSNHQPPFPPFFFLCCCFFFVAGAPAGFWCLGGMMLLVEAGTAAALPGRGEVGGLLTVLLASLKS
jgi:hypothetical protein